MILTDVAIRLNDIMHPCEERGRFRGVSYGLSHCGYDVRADLSPEILDLMTLDTGLRMTMTPDGNGIVLGKGDSALIGVRERFVMPAGVAGMVRDKSTWARQGLMTTQAVLEPGWEGHLAIRVFNVGDDELAIVDGMGIAQVVFHWLDGLPETVYEGKYQDQKRGPQGPRFER